MQSVCRSRKLWFMFGAINALIATVFASAAAEGVPAREPSPFVLNGKELDKVTAAGPQLNALHESVATGLGAPASSFASGDTRVASEKANATVGARAIGPDGSVASGYLETGGLNGDDVYAVTLLGDVVGAPEELAQLYGDGAVVVASDDVDAFGRMAVSGKRTNTEGVVYLQRANTEVEANVFAIADNGDLVGTATAIDGSTKVQGFSDGTAVALDLAGTGENILFGVISLATVDHSDRNITLVAIGDVTASGDAAGSGSTSLEIWHAERFTVGVAKSATNAEGHADRSTRSVTGAEGAPHGGMFLQRTRDGLNSTGEAASLVARDGSETLGLSIAAPDR